MDDLTQAILATHATALEHLAAGQVAIAHGLEAVAAVIKQQQTDGTATAEALRVLNAGIERTQRRIEQKVKESAERAEQIRQTVKGLQPR
jgi:hypothetical protein